MAGLRQGVVVGLGLLLALALSGCGAFLQSWSGVPAAQGAGVSEAGRAKLKGKLADCDRPIEAKALVDQLLRRAEFQTLKGKLERRGKRMQRGLARACKSRGRAGRFNAANALSAPLQTDPALDGEDEVTLVEVPFGEEAALYALMSEATGEDMAWAHVESDEQITVLDVDEEQTYTLPADETALEAYEDLQQDEAFVAFVQELEASGVALDPESVRLLVTEVPGSDEVEVEIALPEPLPPGAVEATPTGWGPESGHFLSMLDPGGRNVHFYRGRAQRVTKTSTTITTRRNSSFKIVRNRGSMRRASSFDLRTQTWCPHRWLRHLSSFRGPHCERYQVKVSKAEVRQTMLSRANVAASLEDSYGITHTRNRTTGSKLLLAGMSGLTERQIKDLLATSQPIRLEAAAKAGDIDIRQSANPSFGTVPTHGRQRKPFLPPRPIGPEEAYLNGTIEEVAEDLAHKILQATGPLNAQQQRRVEKFKEQFISAFSVTTEQKVFCGLLDLVTGPILRVTELDCAQEAWAWMFAITENITITHGLNPQSPDVERILELVSAMTNWMADLSSGDGNRAKGALAEIKVASKAGAHGWEIHRINQELKKADGTTETDLDLVLYNRSKETVAYIQVKARNEDQVQGSIKKDIIGWLNKVVAHIENDPGRFKKSKVHAEVEFASFIFTEKGDFSFVAEKIRNQWGNKGKIPVTVAWRDKQNTVHVECIGCNSKFTQRDAEEAACEMGFCVDAQASESSDSTGMSTVVTGLGLGQTSSSSASRFCRGGYCLTA